MTHENDFGRLQIVRYPEIGLAELVVELPEREEESFWLTIANERLNRPAFQIRFKRIGPGVYRAAEVRPGLGPILSQAFLERLAAGLRPAESAASDEECF